MTLFHLFGRLRGVEWELDESTGCWIWLKGQTKGRPHSFAHRRYWEAANGPRPEGADLHHLCHNGMCVNPDHLVPIDPRDHNVHHFLHENDLDIEDVREIRRLGRVGVGSDELAERYGICRFTVHRYWNGERWAALLGEDGPVVFERPCAHCGAMFTRRQDAKYCSATCQTSAWNRRNRASINARMRAKRLAARLERQEAA